MAKYDCEDCIHEDADSDNANCVKCIQRVNKDSAAGFVPKPPQATITPSLPDISNMEKEFGLSDPADDYDPYTPLIAALKIVSAELNKIAVHLEKK
jgi:hypothetical protein